MSLIGQARARYCPIVVKPRRCHQSTVKMLKSSAQTWMGLGRIHLTNERKLSCQTRLKYRCCLHCINTTINTFGLQKNSDAVRLPQAVSLRHVEEVHRFIRFQVIMYETLKLSCSVGFVIVYTIRAHASAGTGNQLIRFV
jgi:hypothetical protein